MQYNHTEGVTLVTTTQQKSKRAELLVFSELTKRGADLYLPVIDTGIDAIVRRKNGTYVEIQVKSTQVPEQAGWFNVDDLNARGNLFIVCVDMSKEPPESWIVPSKKFVQYANKSTLKKGWIRYTLGIDSKARSEGNKLRRDLLKNYLEAWDLLL